MSLYTPTTGVILQITRPETSAESLGCTLTLTIQSQDQGIIRVNVAPSTYVLNAAPLNIGDQVTCFYSTAAPVPLIYPPLYQAAAVAHTWGRFASMDVFNGMLTNSDDTLRLNLSGTARIILPNGQPFTGYLTGKVLLVVYSTTTRSIPAQTTPEEIVVFCSQP